MTHSQGLVFVFETSRSGASSTSIRICNFGLDDKKLNCKMEMDLMWLPLPTMSCFFAYSSKKKRSSLKTKYAEQMKVTPCSNIQTSMKSTSLQKSSTGWIFHPLIERSKGNVTTWTKCKAHCFICRLLKISSKVPSLLGLILERWLPGVVILHVPCEMRFKVYY